MALNVRSIRANKKLVANYLRDNEIHVLIATECNIAHAGLKKAAIRGFTITNYSCRWDRSKKGGGGGGVLIYVHISAPNEKGADQIAGIKGDLEFRDKNILKLHIRAKY